MSYSSCQLSSSINLSCASNVGGIAKVYLTTGSVTGITTNVDDSISTIAGTGDVYTYEVQKQTSSLTETFNSSLENGTLFYTQVLSLAFHKMEQDKRNQVRLMAQNRNIKGWVEDNNGTIFYVGGIDGDALAGGYLSTATGVSGTAFGDANQYQVELTFFASEPMSTLDDSLANVLSGFTIHA